MANSDSDNEQASTVIEYLWRMFIKDQVEHGCCRRLHFFR